ncbi:PAAR domain-containing protein [Paraburkholderia sp. A1RI-2L]|uniref:PAAR domain-containing protein n=1 Tax=Paraburkholderia sp. A1RI-2L TaxID=3028367 RepID=UPI003B770B1D
MRGIIRVRDATSHGGHFEAGSAVRKVMGRAVAREGDRCTCPIEGRRDCVVAEDDPAFVIGGHKTTCGAILISSLLYSGRN